MKTTSVTIALLCLSALILLVSACGAAPPAPLTGSAAAGSNGNSEPQVIEVRGVGEAQAAPDVAVLVLGISAEANTVEETNGQVQQAMSRLLDSLEENGIQEKDIQTIEFGVDPVHEERNDRWILTGYRVTHMLRVKVRDIDEVGEVIDDAVEAGGDLLRMNRISFGIEDSTALYDEAREEAMADAYAKAEQMAGLAGVRLGKPIYITDSPATSYRPSYSNWGMSTSLMFDAGDFTPTEISSGELEVVVDVHIKYAIG